MNGRGGSVSWRTIVIGVACAGAGYAASALRTPPVERSGDVERLEARLEALTRASEAQHRTALSLAAARRAAPPDPATPAVAPPAPAAVEEPAAAPPTEEEPSEELLLVRAEGEARVARALELGRWSEDDEEKFLELRMAHPDVNWVPVLEQLSAAVNNGRVKPM